MHLILLYIYITESLSLRLSLHPYVLVCDSQAHWQNKRIASTGNEGSALEDHSNARSAANFIPAKSVLALNPVSHLFQYENHLGSSASPGKSFTSCHCNCWPTSSSAICSHERSRFIMLTAIWLWVSFLQTLSRDCCSAMCVCVCVWNFGKIC